MLRNPELDLYMLVGFSPTKCMTQAVQSMHSFYKQVIQICSVNNKISIIAHFYQLLIQVHVYRVIYHWKFIQKTVLTIYEISRL